MLTFNWLSFEKEEISETVHKEHSRATCPGAGEGRVEEKGGEEWWEWGGREGQNAFSLGLFMLSKSYYCFTYYKIK